MKVFTLNMELMLKNRKLFHSIILILVSTVILYGLYQASEYNYLLFHCIIELFSVIIACGIFMIAWNSRSFLTNHFYLFLGIAYLFIGGLDLIHTLAYKNMIIFPGYAANVPSQFWISARYMEAASLVIAPLLIHKKINPHLIFFIYLLSYVVAILSIFVWAIFPDCLIESKGALSTFKIYSEYIIISLLLLSAILLYFRKKDLDLPLFYLLLASIFITILAELAFTLYNNVFDQDNFLGHILKIISFYLIYNCLIKRSLINPYKSLFKQLAAAKENFKFSEEKYHSIFESSVIGIGMTDENGNVIESNDAMFTMTGYSKKDMAQFNVMNLYERAEQRTELLNIIQRQGHVKDYKTRLRKKDGSIFWASISARFIKIKGKAVLITSCIDITNMMQAEKSLRESEELYRVTLSEISDTIFITDDDSAFTFICPNVHKIFGYSQQEIEHLDSISDLLGDYHFDLDKLLKTGEISNIDLDVKDKFGRVHSLFINIKQVFIQGGTLLYTCRDVSERNKMQNQIQRSLIEKETLLREIHHRVKNNLQTIISLLRLQNYKTNDAITLELLKECEHRIKSMAFIHEKLYQSDNFSNIEFHQYIRELINYLFSSYGVNYNQIQLDLNLNQITLALDQAIPCGLLINELISNSLKYAFPNNSQGKITVSMHVLDNTIELDIGDNGIGIPENLTFSNCETLGLLLVKGWVEQIMGNIELDRSQGILFKITFRKH